MNKVCLFQYGVLYDVQPEFMKCEVVICLCPGPLQEVRISVATSQRPVSERQSTGYRERRREEEAQQTRCAHR